MSAQSPTPVVLVLGSEEMNNSMFFILMIGHSGINLPLCYSDTQPCVR